MFIIQIVTIYTTLVQKESTYIPAGGKRLQHKMFSYKFAVMVFMWFTRNISIHVVMMLACMETFLVVTYSTCMKPITANSYENILCCNSLPPMIPLHSEYSIPQC